MAGKTALPVPAAVAPATDATEILRVWIVNSEQLATVFPPNLYGEDIWKWGRLLANIARYVANSHAQLQDVSEADALEALRVNFDEELRRAKTVGVVTGGLKKPGS